MRYRPALLAFLLLALAAVPGVAGPAALRLHRVHLPPPPANPLPQSLAVDEFEYGIRGTHLEVAAGHLRIHAYNRGMDDHDLSVDSPSRTVHYATIEVPAGSTDDPPHVTVDLAPGQYVLFCGLPGHEQAGMISTITVR